MILVEKTLGNIKDAAWHERAHKADVEYLVLEQWEAPKNRLRKTSDSGLELAISLSRSEHLHDGDVLYHDAEAGRIVVARIALKEVMVIEMQDLEGLSPAEILRISFELGHGLGNQHWPAVIKGTTIYVPLSVDQKVMSSVMRTHAFKRATMHFEPGEQVAAKLDAKEVRLLFAGADATPHHHHGSHHHDHDHDHDHDHEHHHHEHGGGHSHDAGH
ncbi:MAG: urease accessory protein UreE [Mesorhizobium sp.]|nr:urease accessory protein UreE [Mesorhizobium sp.]MBL8579891.1 urease accessory protein UreE [Mesorhizobium sp.]